MKKTLSLAVLILLIWNQPSFAESNWFNQKPTQSQPVEPVGPKVGDAIPIPKTVDPQTNQSAAVLLKQPCDRADKMFAVLKQHRELLLFTGEGVTFGMQGQPYNGALMFFINQDTGSWTALQVYKDNMACMIFNGKQFQPYTGKQPDYGSTN
tara:strand:- start:3009 stop:3464 length:456 start_codon:yes stop_codon:yes gene_type:complete